jgi:hypothetical protein
MEGMMSNPNRNPVEQLQAFIEAYLDDLQEKTDAELLSDPTLAKTQAFRFSRLVSAAKVEVGRRRLSAARRAVAAQAGDPRPLPPVDLVEARRFIAEAANEARITLAARDLVEMPDEDIERIYRQLKELDPPPLTKTE